MGKCTGGELEKNTQVETNQRGEAFTVYGSLVPMKPGRVDSGHILDSSSKRLTALRRSKGRSLENVKPERARPKTRVDIS